MNILLSPRTTLFEAIIHPSIPHASWPPLSFCEVPVGHRVVQSGSLNRVPSRKILYRVSEPSVANIQASLQYP